jgi:hypothetical protein
MSKEYTIYGDYIINEPFSAYINVPNNIKTFSDMTIDQIVYLISKLSVIDSASLLSTMCDSPENIQRVSLILLQLPINKVYSIIPTMTVEPSYVSISVIVSILLYMPISTIALIIANMNIPQLIVFPIESNNSTMLYLLKAAILSDTKMPTEKSALILSDSNMPSCQAELILSSMLKETSLLILSKMSSTQAAMILSNIT